MSHVMNTYARLPVTFSHGEGCRITDTDGKEYLDALSGIAVSTLGHAHPRLVAAIAAQAGRMLHTSNLYRIAEQEQLADKLCALSGMAEVFFGNSGAEANEAAIKLARFYGHKKNVELPTVIVMEKAFHGRTMATLSATGNRKAQAGFEPNDPLARPTTATIPAASGPAITMASPPNGLLLAATVCAVIGGVIGALGWGQWWSLLGWVLAGPIAIWLVARFVAVDTERKTATVYSRPGSTGLWWVVALVAVVVGIAVTALAVGFWVGQL